MIRRHLAVLPVCALVGWLLLVPFRFQLEANADTERDLFRTWGLLQGDWPDKGPRIDHSPLSLGPGWYLVTAPVLAVSGGSVYGVHAGHVGWLLAGLILLYLGLTRSMSRSTALTICLALGTSNYLAQVMVRVWHPAQFPAVALLWFGLLGLGTTALSLRARARALAAAWVLTGLLLQLHLVGLAYAATLALVSAAHYRRHGRAGGRGPLALTGLVVGALAVGYGWVAITTDLSQLTALGSRRLSRDDAVTAALSELPQFFASGWATPDLHFVGWLLLAAAVLGIARVIRTARHGLGLGGWALLQVLIGLPLVLYFARLAPQARYFSGVVPGLFVLAAWGLDPLIRGLKRRWRPAVPLAAGLLAVSGGWFAWPTADGEPPQTLGELTLHEQQTFIEHARDTFGLPPGQVARRTHGSVFGGLSAIRWVAFASDPPSALPERALRPDEDLWVGPRGFPEPAELTQRLVITQPGTRPLVIGRLTRPVDPLQVTATVAGAPCPIAIPYRWGPLTTREYAEFGVRHGLDVERCRGSRRDAPLTVRVAESPAGRPMTLLVSWYDVAARYPDRAELTLTDAQGRPLDAERLAGEQLRNMAAWRFTPPSGGFQVQVAPLSTLAVLDLY